MKYKKINGFTILNEPKPYKLSDYYEVREKVVSIFKNIPGLVSIYQMGSISCPGISDLDLILVFEDGCDKIEFSSFYKMFDSRDKYILMHSPFAIPKSLFNNMKYFYVPQNFVLILGEEQTINKIPDYDLLSRIVSVEFVIGLLCTTMRAHHSKIINARSLMNGLYSVKHDLAVFRLSRKECPFAWDFVHTLCELRTNWFESSEDASLYRLINTIINSSSILHSLLKSFSYSMENEIGIHDTMMNRKLIFGINNWLLFKNSERDYYVKERSLFSVLKYLRFSNLLNDARWIFSDYIVKLPYSLCILLSEKSSQTGNNTLKQKSIFIDEYLKYSARFSGFSYLLPPIRVYPTMDNIKWLFLHIAKKIIKDIW